MSMSIPREAKKNLTAMTLSELQDLLQRQQRLVANKSFVNKLPDKGEKMLGLIERVTAAIKTHRQVDETADLFQQLALNADTARRRTAEDEDNDFLGSIVNHPVQDKVMVDDRPDKVADEWQDERGHDRGDGIYFTETYKRVIKTPNKGELVTERFVPNKIPQRLAVDKKQQPNMQSQPVTSSATSHKGPHRPPAPGSRLQHRYDDSLEEDMRGAPGVHDKTKMISIEESVSLLQTQKKHQEEVQTKQAMDRLAQRLGIKVDKVTTFDPEGSRKMTYRVTEEIDSDDDSDDDAQEKDYPDEPSSGTKVKSSSGTKVKSSSGLRQSVLGSVRSEHVT